MLVKPGSFIFCRQRRIEIHFQMADQELDALRQSGIDGCEPLGMGGHIVRQEVQKVAHHRVFACRLSSACEHNIAIWADREEDFVALAKPQGTANSLWHRGLVTLSECG